MWGQNFIGVVLHKVWMETKKKMEETLECENCNLIADEVFLFMNVILTNLCSCICNILTFLFQKSCWDFLIVTIYAKIHVFFVTVLHTVSY